jgi:predicted lipoprotein with Yx(FWY)xxD motif
LNFRHRIETSAAAGKKSVALFVCIGKPSPEEENVKQTSYRSLALAAVAVLIAACGSSSSSRTAPKAAATPTTGTSGSTTTSPGGATPVKLVTKHNKLGTILAAGPKQLTVYLFEGDKGTTSRCIGACAKAWPPVIVSGEPEAGGTAQMSSVGTTTRPDGTKQLTYKGHPLYFFSKDKDDGDAYGEGAKAFGAEWYVLSPSGAKIDKS